jgi:hypothetical protein
MPIRPFLNGRRFDPETLRVLGVAFVQVCIALRVGDCDHDVKQAIADKVIAGAGAGERNPDILCERVLEDIRRPSATRSAAALPRRHAPEAPGVVGVGTASGIAG